jgi:hypothetical protein
MKYLRNCTIAAVLMAAPFVAPTVRAQGLYGDEGKKAVGGDLNDQDYWWSKYDAMMLEIAIKQRQPEGSIAVNIAVDLRRLNDLVKKYPMHKEIAQMKARAEEVDAKINPNADRRQGFTPECPWDESNFAQLWVNLHWAKTAFDAKDYNTALSCMQNVTQNYGIMMRPDRMQHYPEDLRKYVEDNKAAADSLYKATKAKLGRG